MTARDYRLVRLLGWAMLFLALLTVGTGLYVQAQMRKQTSCQANYNQAFVEQLKARSEITDDDRKSLAELVQSVSTSRSRAQSAAALKKYLETKAENDKQRAAHPLPDLPSFTHC